MVRKEATRKRPVISRDEVALTEYMRRATARGMSDFEIDYCLANGWSDAEIQETRRLLSDEDL